MWNVGFSPVGSATVLRVKSHSGEDHEAVVSGHLIGRPSPCRLMNTITNRVLL